MRISIIGFLAVALLSFGFSRPAAAGVHIEPYVGYGMGKAGGTTKDDMKGMGYGARLGYGMLGFAFGGEYTGGTYTLDSNPSVDGSVGDIGAFASYKFPVFVRVFATYFLQSNLKMANSGGDYSGNGMKLGIGFTTLPFVNINLEYWTSTYDKVKAGGTTTTLTTKVDSKLTMISISLPFDL